CPRPTRGFAACQSKLSRPHSLPESEALRKGELSEPADCGGDALVTGGQRNAHMLCTASAVELAGRHQDAALGQPRDAVPARLTAGGPQIEACVGIVDSKTG